MTTELILYDEMCRAIAAAHGVDEVKDIRDKAMAIEIYSRQARNVENEKRAIEIRIRAERRCGELLAHKNATASLEGSNQHQERSHAETDPPTLAVAALAGAAVVVIGAALRHPSTVATGGTGPGIAGSRPGLQVADHCRDLRMPLRVCSLR